MPFVRINTLQKLTTEQKALISDAIQQGIENQLKAPKDDRFQVFVDQSAGLVYDRHYLNIDRSDSTLFIQVFLKKGRTSEMKQAFYASVCGRLNALGFRKEDVFIFLSENEACDWSFGNGKAQLIE